MRWRNRKKVVPGIAALCMVLLFPSTVFGLAEDGIGGPCGEGLHEWCQISEMPATCTDFGEFVYECMECGVIERMEVPPFGHTYDDWRVSEEATCVSEGQMQRMCTYCGMAEYDVIPCTGHTYGSWSISREAGSASMGERQAVCTMCGAVITEAYYPNGSLYRGMGQNDAVKAMQQKLIDMSFLNDSADGIFGKNTEAAVYAFQEICGLEQTGIAFPQTMDMVEERYAVFLTEQEQKEQQSGTSFCILYPGELDGTHIAYCDIHYQIYEQESMLLKDKEVQEVDSSVYRELCALWQEETERLYDEWAESTTEDRKADVERAKASFLEYAKAQRSIWELEYPSEPEIVEWKTLGLWKDYCICLCSHLSNLEFLNTGGDVTGDTCFLWYDDLNGLHIAYCEKHAPLRPETDAAFNNGDELHDVRIKWEEAVTELYDECAAYALPEDRAVYGEAKKLFLKHLDEYETAMQGLYPDDLRSPEYNVIMELEKKCVELCEAKAMAADSARPNY